MRASSAAPSGARPRGASSGRSAAFREAARRDRLDVFFAPAYSCPLSLDVPRVTTVHDMSFFSIPDDFSLADGLAAAAPRGAEPRRLPPRRRRLGFHPARDPRPLPGRRGARDRDPPRRRRRHPRCHRPRLGAAGASGRRPVPRERRLDPEPPPPSDPASGAWPSCAGTIPGSCWRSWERTARTLGRLPRPGLEPRPRGPRPPLGLRRATPVSRSATPRPTPPSTCRSTRASACRWREAMARGVPVVTSDRPATGEIFAGAALLADPSDAFAVADALRSRARRARSRRATWWRAGGPWSQGLTWAKAAAATRDVLAGAAR